MGWTKEKGELYRSPTSGSSNLIVLGTASTSPSDLDINSTLVLLLPSVAYLVQSSQIWLAGFILTPQRSCWYLWFWCKSPPHFLHNILLCLSTVYVQQHRIRLLLAHMEVAQICWWKEGAVEACCRDQGQGLIPSWLASFQPRGAVVLQQSKAWGLLTPRHHHHHPPWGWWMLRPLPTAGRKH